MKKLLSLVACLALVMSGTTAICHASNTAEVRREVSCRTSCSPKDKQCKPCSDCDSWFAKAKAWFSNLFCCNTSKKTSKKDIQEKQPHQDACSHSDCNDCCESDASPFTE